jgi:hypothetical protein
MLVALILWLLPVPIVLGVGAGILVERGRRTSTNPAFWLAFIAMALTIPLTALISFAVIPRDLPVENLTLLRAAYLGLEIAIGLLLEIGILATMGRRIPKVDDPN